MFDWLIGAIVFGLGSVDKLAEKVRNSIATLWSALVDFFTEQMNAAGYVSREAGNIFTQSVALAIALFKLGTYIIYQSIPRWAQLVISQLSNWALGQIQNASNLLHSAINDARNWAGSAISAARAEFQALVTDIRNTIGTIVSVLNWTRDHVQQLLTDPMILAQWLFLPLWRVAKGWVEVNSVALARWGLGMAVRGTIMAASLLEDIIVSIF